MPTQKQFEGKAIYSPSGKAGEYAMWACNFYVGCSNGCTYCYLKKGRCKAIMGGDVPTLKKCFKNEHHALHVFEKELKANLPELQKHGLFFSFTTDPLLEQTIKLTDRAISLCVFYDIPVKILTKRADWIDGYCIRNGNIFVDFPCYFEEKYRSKIAFGFTLTGHDELETGASTNAERIEAMKKLHDAGFKTFASIEPVIDISSSIWVIHRVFTFCDLFKIGLESGKKYDKDDLIHFIKYIISKNELFGKKIYFKDSLLKKAGIERESLPANCVTMDYNLFNN